MARSARRSGDSSSNDPSSNDPSSSNPSSNGHDSGDPTERFADELDGLDHEDPEVRAFAEHLDRMHHSYSRATVEGMLRGVGIFAHSANRARGNRRVAAVLVVSLMLFGVLFTVWNAVVYMVQTFSG